MRSYVSSTLSFTLSLTTALGLQACVTSADDGSISSGSTDPDATVPAGSTLYTAVPSAEFGHAVAVGDFNGDHFDDLAIGIPGSTPFFGGTGKVMVFLGSPIGLLPGPTITEAQLNPSGAQAGDQFGFTLVAGDIDGDGKADLAIGAPHARTPEHTARGGVVYVMWGGTSGLGVAGSLTLAQDHNGLGGIPEDGDRFGNAIDIGPLHRRTANDHSQDLVVGVPLESVDGESQNGYVQTFLSAGRTLRPKHAIAMPIDPAKNGAHFGASVAIGDLDNDGLGDVIVGAPGTGSATPALRGEAFVYRGTEGNETAFAAPIPLLQPSSIENGQFGTAIAIGAFDGATYGGGTEKKREIAVSAIGQNSGSGRIYTYRPTVSGSSLTFAAPQVISQAAISGGTNLIDDRFGSAMATGNDNGDGLRDLVVGIPFKSGVVSPAGAGALGVLRGSSAGLGNGSYLTWFLSPDGSQIPEEGDALGSSVATGDFNNDGRMDIAAGLPTRGDFAGAVLVWTGSISGPGLFAFLGQ